MLAPLACLSLLFYHTLRMSAEAERMQEASLEAFCNLDLGRHPRYDPPDNVIILVSIVHRLSRAHIVYLYRPC